MTHKVLGYASQTGGIIQCLWLERILNMLWSLAVDCMLFLTCKWRGLADASFQSHRTGSIPCELARWLLQPDGLLGHVCEDTSLSRLFTIMRLIDGPLLQPHHGEVGEPDRLL